MQSVRGTWSTRIRPGSIALLVVLAGIPGRGTANEPDWLAWSSGPAAPRSAQGAFAGAVDGVLMVAGGGVRQADGSMEWDNRVHALVMSARGPDAWREVGPLPVATGNGAAVSAPEGLWCIGGETSAGAVATVWRIQWAGEAGGGIRIRDDLPPLPRATVGAAASLHAGTLYVAGGLVDGRPARQFLAMDTRAADPVWRELAAWDGPAVHAAALVVQGTADAPALFLIGGMAAHGPAHGVHRYDPDTAHWSRVAALPQTPGRVVAVRMGSAHLLVLPGAESGQGQSPAWGYHTITGVWNAIPRGMPAAGSVHALTGLDGGWVVLAEHAGQPVTAIGRLQSAARHFRQIDYIVLAAYLGCIVLIGLYFSKRGATTNDYFLAGNRIPWWAAGISLLATQVSSIGFMAVPAKVFATDWAYFLGVFTWFLVVPLVTRYYIPYFRRIHVASAYSYLEERFNVCVRLFAGLSFCALQIGRLAVVMFLPALALATVTDLDLTACILLMGLIATLYTITGGMAAVVWTDVAQAILLIAGALFAVAVVFVRIDGGAAEFFAVVARDNKMRMVLPTMDIGAAAAWVIIVGNVFSRLANLTSDQSIIQRYLTTPDVRASRRALWLDVAASVPWAIIVFLFGTALYVFYQAHPDLLHPAVSTDGIVPLFIAQMLPPGVSGMLIAAIFAAAMSSLDSAMHSTSTVLVSDVYARFWPRSSERARLLLAKGIVLVLGVFGTLAAIYLAQAGVKSIWDQFITIVGLFVGVLAGLFLLGVFTVRTDGWDALIGACAGSLATFWVSQCTRVSFFLYPAVGVIVCVLVACATSWIPRRRRWRPQRTAAACRATR